MYAFRFFFAYELPKIDGMASSLLSKDGLTLSARPEYFDD